MKFTVKNGFTTTPERSNHMKKIRSTNTKPELMLRRLLWSKGYRYRINYKPLPGRPDIVLTKSKIAIFIDGEFWHGHNWEEKKLKLKSNSLFWIPKIEKNMLRDEKNNQDLLKMGYGVIRFWGNDVLKTPNLCLARIMEKLSPSKIINP